MDWLLASSTDGFTSSGEVISSMGSIAIAFVGSVVGNLWGLFLSLGLLAFAGGYILRKTGIGRR